MKVFLRGDKAVPIIIAKRHVKQEPKIVKKRRFVGIKRGIGTLVDKAIDLVLDCFWDTEQEVLDAGETDVVHYALDILDTAGQGQPELVVTKLHGRAHPGCGLYCEVISPTPIENPGEPLDPYEPSAEESRARMVQPKRRRPNAPPRDHGDDDDDDDIDEDLVGKSTII